MTEAPSQTSLEAPGPRKGETFLFTACFVALMATSFAFIIRIMVMDAWQAQFGLSETQKGEIFGAGFWPFGISIVLFSLIVDRIGYGKSMIFAFLCHVASTVLLVTAKGYWGLYVGSCLNGLAAGTIEAVINPAIASMFPRSKTKMLTILHAGWPGGMVVGGLVLLLMQPGGYGWEVKVGVILAPVVIYGLMLIGCRFPVHERVAAGIPYRDMLKEAGALGCLIVLYMVIMEVNRVAGLKNLLETSFFSLPNQWLTVLIGVLTLVYLVYTRSLGRWMYILLLLVMILLATTELGVDSWVTGLMAPAMGKVGLNPVLVLLYTSTIMALLRLCIGPIVKVLKPLGVLLCCAVIAAVGLSVLSGAQGILILIAATIYGIGKTYFWPVTLGVVSERFPRGGALTINAIAGVGMLGVGILGNPLLGFWQDTRIDQKLKAGHPAVYSLVMQKEAKKSTVGEYRCLDQGKVNEIHDQAALGDSLAKEAKKRNLKADSDTAVIEVALALADDKDWKPLVQTVVARVKPVKPEEPGERAAARQQAEYKAKLDKYEVDQAAYKKTDSYPGRVAYLAEKGMLVFGEKLDGVRKTSDILKTVGDDAKKNALSRVALLPVIMAVCYLCLVIFVRARGGYKAVHLAGQSQGGGH